MKANMKERTMSIWEGTAKEDPAFSSLAGRKEADVVIIGGGIAGLTSAGMATLCIS